MRFSSLCKNLIPAYDSVKVVLKIERIFESYMYDDDDKCTSIFMSPSVHDLPQSVKYVVSINKFEQSVKLYLFNQLYN